MIHLPQLSGEEKILQSRFQDAINASRFKNQMKFIGFLDIRQQEILKSVAASARFFLGSFMGDFKKQSEK